MKKFLLIFFNSIIFFLIINFLITISWPIYSKLNRDKHNYKPEQVELFNMPDKELIILYNELWKDHDRFKFIPFIGHSETSRTGKYVNFNEEDGRKVERPKNCILNVYLYGGSTTFGYNVQDKDTIGQYLQNYLGKEYCVFNHGRAYFYSKQENNIFSLHLENRKKINFAVFLDGVNERCGGYKFQNNLSSIFNILNTRPYYMWKNSLKNLIYTLPISQFYFSLFTKHQLIDFYDDLIQIDSCKNKISIDNLFKIRTSLRHGLCKELKINCYSFIQPMPGVHGNQIEEFLNIEKQAKFKKKYNKLLKSGKYIIDLGYILNDTNELSFIDGVHYTPKTNSIIAKALVNYIVK